MAGIRVSTAATRFGETTVAATKAPMKTFWRPNGALMAGAVLADAVAFPRIVLNAKVYAEATGGLAALSLARACQAEARRMGQPVGFAPPATELGALGRSRMAPA